MLLIFSTSDRLAILTKIGAVVSNFPDTPIRFAQDLAELAQLLPLAKAVFCMGSTSLELLQSQGHAPKNRKVTGLRKQVLKVGAIPMMCTYSPSIGDIDYGQFIDMLTDTGLALRLATTGTTAPKYGSYHYHSNLKEIVKGVSDLVAQGARVDLAFDTETLGLDRFHTDGYIIGLQFSWKKGTGHMVAFPSKKASLDFLRNMDNQADLFYLLNCPDISVRAANGKYDLEWIYEQTGISCTNFNFDTTLVGSLLDENRSNGLDVHVKIYAPELGGYSDEFDQKADKSRMDLEYAKSPSDFLNYSAGDADGTLQVAAAQKSILLQNEPLTRFYVNILHPAARAFELIERGGVHVDINEFNALESDLIADLKRLIIKGKSIIGGLLAAKHYDADKNGGINLTKAALINDFMFSPAGLNLKPKMLTEKTKAPVTSLEHLEMFADVPEAKEFVNTMREFSSTNKTLSTYIVGFRKDLRSDGRFHPSYWLHRGDRDNGDGGTNTGRLSVTNPAFQCCIGSTLVLSDKGTVPISDIVLQYEQGQKYKVLTHTGKWRDVVGVYHNGVQPVFEVKASNGFSVTCTANHPILTDRGWVRTDQLKEGDTCYAHKGNGSESQNSWYDDGSGTDENCSVERQVFEEVLIVSITPRGGAETFDITVDKSHSFVANGLAVHNTIPKHTTWGKRIRRCYTAPAGMVVLESDYSQGELKVIACLAHEHNMIEAYKNGKDLHVITSSGVAGLTYDEMVALKKTDKEKYDAIRQLGKAGNFGLIYGMGVDGFMEYAKTSYGVTLSKKEAEDFRNKFFATYPRLLTYHTTYKNFAKKNGYVSGPLGRIRHLPLINSPRQEVRAQEERRSINSPVQGTLSDMMIWAIAEQANMGWFEKTPCFGAIHDAGYYYLPEDEAEASAKRIVQVMENLPFQKVGWDPQLKFTADAKIGPSMGVLTELKF